MRRLLEHLPNRQDVRESARDLRGLWPLGLILVGLYAVSFVVVQVTRATFKPPGNATTVRELRDAGEPVTRLAWVEVAGRRYLVWLGTSRLLAAPSGPACFVFDERGVLVKYTVATGDLELTEFCDAAWDKTSLSLEEALASTEKR